METGQEMCESYCHKEQCGGWSWKRLIRGWSNQYGVSHFSL